jgi:hypothetical protein
MFHWNLLSQHIKQFSASLVLVLAFLLYGGVGHAQVIPAVLHKKSNAGELRKYYSDRLVEINYTVTKPGGASETIFGTGILISSDGVILTARHVVDPIFDNLVKLEDVHVLLYRDLTSVPLKLVPDLPDVKVNARSVRSDTALLKVVAPGGQPLPYMCIDRSDPNLDPGETVTMASYEHSGNPLNVTRQTFTPGVKITHPAGPGAMFRYLGLAQPIEASMSGGAVVRDKTDRVIAVMSNVLVQDGKNIPGDNYANLLQSATDIGLDAIPPCLPDRLDIKRAASQTEFMSSTCQGTLAWIPEGAGGEHWMFPESGKYILRRKDLPACSEGGEGQKSVRIVINSSIAGRCKKNEARCGFPIGLATIYGVQLVPVIREGDEGIVDQETWLFRNASLLSRRKDGGYFVAGKGAQPQIIRSTPPVAYNDATRVASQILDQGSTTCGAAVNSQSCGDILALQRFAQVLRMKQPWHGFVRKGSQSTLSLAGEASWLVRDDWRAAGHNVQVKNWILRYSGTKELQTKRPVNFTFCVDPKWTEFYLRTFSPERCAEPKLIHVTIVD